MYNSRIHKFSQHVQREALYAISFIVLSRVFQATRLRKLNRLEEVRKKP